MVIVEPWGPQPVFPPFPTYPDPNPYPLDPYPDVTTTLNIVEANKKWMEKHIKDVKKGILITFEGNEEPIFIATDDKCWDKIMEAVKDEPKKKSK